MTAPVALEVAPGLFRIERVEPNGWSLAMHVLKLPSGGLLVHSPTRMGAEVFSTLDALGKVELLLAPNHFHHMGIERYSAQYPEALAFCSSAALPRLRRKGRKKLRPMEEMVSRLPENVRMLEPAGLRNGEVFLFLEAPVKNTLLVADAFFHVNRRVTGPTGAVLRLLRILPGLQMGRTFTLVGVRDGARFKAWLRAELPTLAPRQLLVSHGEPLVDDALVARLLAVSEAAI